MTDYAKLSLFDNSYQHVIGSYPVPCYPFSGLNIHITKGWHSLDQWFIMPGYMNINVPTWIIKYLGLLSGLPLRTLQDIHKAEWSPLDRDFTFCEPGTPRNHLCEEFTTESNSGGIRMPFDGYFTIRCQVAWKSPRLNSSSSKLVLNMTRVARGTPREPLGLDYAYPQGNCSNVPCAVAQVHQTLRLERGDQIYISINHKDYLDPSPAYTFLEISGESL